MSEPRLKNKITDQTIFDNYATPLVGQFLNLPKEPVDITCPACHIRAPSELRNDIIPAKCAGECLTQLRHLENERRPGMFCCCFCRTFSHPCRHTDTNHYCKNCGCYFGRVMKPKKYLKKTKAK